MNVHLFGAYFCMEDCWNKRGIHVKYVSPGHPAEELYQFPCLQNRALQFSFPGAMPKLVT